ncbi:MAG TPA: glycosyltransferase family 39 protein [Candidatus Dormibacteraeota bacterium]|jgi:4-amino-4-deoxy-L-arabinose transferase-like glycosyltransferase|nr:glycosyltransferase family 39 protein [Candidatus Dormibacteraeota bacterium]
MTNDDSTAIPTTSISPAARIGWGALIVVTLAVCYFCNLGAIGFVGPDEPRYAWIARDMAETGDWVTPRLYGKPWFEKPVLYYWMAGASFKLFGVSEAAARLPSAICALFATLALAWLAWRIYGAETAQWLLLLLPTSVGMIGFSHAAATDMPFSGMLTIAMVCAAVILGLVQNENTPILPRTPWFALILFGFFLGLAVLAKGPAAIILCGGAVFFWALFTKKWRNAFRLLHPAAIASFCATALPWYVLCARRNPDFFRVFIIEHNFRRYLTPEFQHIQPFWYYIPVLSVAFLPWLALALGALVGWSAAKFSFRPNQSTIYFLCWALFCVAFFSTSKSKLPGYILPGFPVVILLSSVAVSSARSILRKAILIACVIAGVLFIATGLVVVVSHRFPEKFIDLEPSAVILVLAMGVANLLLAVALKARSKTTAHVVLTSLSIAQILFLMGGMNLLAKRTEFWGMAPGGIASVVAHDGIPIAHLRTLGLKRDAQYALNFYLHREIKDWREDPVDDGFVLSNGLYCDQINPRLACHDLWSRRDFVSGAWALLRITPRGSADGSASSGQVR